MSVGQAESSGKGSRACHNSFSFEESQALISSKSWQGDLISSFICVLEAQRETETVSKAQWVLGLAFGSDCLAKWPLSRHGG